MKLSEYLAREKLTASAFAAQVDVTHVAIVRYLNGTRRPEWPIIQRIMDVTAGEVTANDFMEAA